MYIDVDALAPGVGLNCASVIAIVQDGRTKCIGPASATLGQRDVWGVHRVGLDSEIF